MNENNQQNTSMAISSMADSTIAHPNEICFDMDSYDDLLVFWDDFNNTIQALMNCGYDVILFERFGIYIVSYDFADDKLSKFSARWIPKDDECDECITGRCPICFKHL